MSQLPQGPHGPDAPRAPRAHVNLPGNCASPIAAAPAGVLVVDKPLRMSSMAAVAAVRLKLAGSDRKRARTIKVGHAGTLDPLATGVLVIAIGKATKLIDRLMSGSKRYVTVIDLTAFTSTDDLEGERVEVATAAPPSEAAVRQAVAGFTGRILQRPPAFSAKKVNGQRAYKMARSGQSPELAPREVFVQSIEIDNYRWPTLELRIHCDKGFYVRSLARELGQALGTGGHCVSIRRTAVGPFTIEMARQLNDLPSPLTEGDFLNVASTMALMEPEDAAPTS